MNIKLTNVVNVDKLFETIDKCEGKVEVITEGNGRLNLKSKFNQYVALVKIFSCGKIDQVEVVTEKINDTERIINYMINSAAV